MRSSLGCLTAAGAAAALSLATGSEAEASCHGTLFSTGPYEDNVSAYATACAIGSTSSTITYGTMGICLASISAAVNCALTTLSSSSAGATYDYVLSVGTASSSSITVDLTHDLSLQHALTPPSAYPTTATFPIDGSGMTQAISASCTTGMRNGCLTIQGSGGSPTLTVIKTADGAQEVYVKHWSHLLFQDLTFTMPIEIMDQGTLVSTGTTTIVSGSTTLQFATATIDTIPQTNIPLIENPQNFAALTPASSSLLFSPVNTTLTVDIPNTGPGCADGTIVLSVGAAGLATVVGIAVAPNCPGGYPTSPAPVTTTLTGTLPGVGIGTAAFYVAYTPSPLAAWIRALNVDYPKGNNFQNFAKAYTIADAPVSVASSTPTTGGFIENRKLWGSPYFPTLGVSVPVPPSHPGGTGLNPNRWTLVLNDALPGTFVPPYWQSPSNYVCLHHDDQTVVEVINTTLSGSANGGSDIIFDNVIWQDMSRAEFHGNPYTQITNSQISRDTLAYAGQTIVSSGNTYNVAPCYSSNNGGPQLSGFSEPPTYGNVISNFNATATGDVSVQVANDVGGVPITNTLHLWIDFMSPKQYWLFKHYKRNQVSYPSLE